MKKYLIFIFIGLVFSGCISLNVTEKNKEQQTHFYGMYSYTSNTAVFRECATNKKFSVSFEKDYISLQKAYLNTKKEPAEYVKVELVGHIVLRDGNVPTLIVKKFINIIPKELCQNQNSKASLENTYWKLTMLNGKPLANTKAHSTEAYMILDQGKIKGNSGCNVMGGKYNLNNDKISLSNKGMMMTRMFCKGSVEAEFIKALKKMYRYEIKGEYLEIFDKNSSTLARFESVYLY